MINAALAKAYTKLLGLGPASDASDWQVAEELMEIFSIPKLGEELAKEVIYAVVLDIQYPNQELTSRIVGRAEGFANELWDDLPDEVHMSDLERKRTLERQRSEQQKELVAR